MPRQLRMEYEGAIYQVMSRDNRRENIFRDEADRERFLGILAKACGKTQWEVHANGDRPHIAGPPTPGGDDDAKSTLTVFTT